MANKTNKYAAEITELITLLGGRDNVSSAMHCVSRLRLVVNDMTLVDDGAISKLASSRGTIKLQNNQYHVIIGADIPTYFKEFSKQTNISASTKAELKNDAASNGTFLQRMMQHFSEIFIPLIPALVAGGLILGFRNILEANFNGFVIVNESAFMKGVNDFLWIPAQAVFWYLPVTLSWSIFKKMGGSQVLGIIIGLSMLLPPLINTYGVSGGGKGVQWIWDMDLNKFGFNFGSFKFPWKISYTAQVIPAIGVAFAGVYIERGLNRIVTPILKQIIVPLGVILGAYILAMVIIGPIGWTIGTAISFAVKWALTNPIAKFIFAPIFGLLYAPLVVTGMHHMLNAVMIQNTATIGGSLFFPILAISNIAQGAAALAFTLAHKKSEKMKQVGYSATTAAWLGVTEPAMYGINIRYIAPFIAGIIGSSVGALFVTIAGVSSAGIGNGAWLGTLSMQAQSGISGVHTWAGTGYLWFLIAASMAAAISIFVTLTLRKHPRFKKIEARVGIL
ncbi:PTS transporter subunit EIIC [Mycoplasma todarodis]|uniref:PTS sugar transporter subunit IIA n=1 Tax=Mycoplasma todarodis TaxID=1937191 RepID=A0A4R0XU01_9MOLU|nr:PTS transporter subunit EIIC [Mycoplasma todarodis]TCG11267.1 PTS sugar transporter subunit IIA [Mycoplasma todarodis]